MDESSSDPAGSRAVHAERAEELRRDEGAWRQAAEALQRTSPDPAVRRRAPRRPARPDPLLSEGLFGPSKRPWEPATSGAMVGPGPGPEPHRFAADLLERVALQYPHPDVVRLYEERRRGR